MSKKSILFIAPSKSNAGTNSSLSGIYNLLKESYSISVLVIKNEGDGTYEFLETAIILPLLNTYYNDFANLSFNEKILSFLVKPQKKFSALFGVNLHHYMLKRCVRRFEKSRCFDVIVAFQEGHATFIADLFSNPNKIAWVHSDIFRNDKTLSNATLNYYDFQNIVCVSKYTRNKFAEHYPKLNDRIQYIYNLVDFKRIMDYSFLPIEDNRFRTDEFTIISLGRMDPVKQFSLIPEIAKKLKFEQLKFRWYILGGPMNCEFEKIKSAIEANEVENEVFLLGNIVNPYPYLKRSDLYVSTSFSEACPMVFIEARLCGIPIASSNFGSASEFISDSHDGFLSSIDNLYEKIGQMISDKELYARIKLNSDNRKVYNDETIEKLKKLFG